MSRVDGSAAGALSAGPALGDWKRAALPLALMMAAPAIAEDGDPRFCPSRPSLGSSACTTKPGEVQLEVSAVDWQRDRSGAGRDTSTNFGDFLARVGVGPSTEIQIGWIPYGRDQMVDEPGGAVQRTHGIGDVSLGFRQNLRNPDGKGLSFGIEGAVTLPTGHGAIGGGDWAASIDVPISYQVSDFLSLSLTTEADAAVDQDRSGRHFAGDMIATASLHPVKRVTLYTEAEVVRDQDPSGHTTQVFAGEGLAVKASKRISLWAETVAGLNAQSPDVRTYTGFTILF
ncbi:transporter [Sphingomonas morindae]|uniref:Transporter n=1 Tax=Sphingomonas morindae TaxID=1541170 RepID=A0ABY4XE83_9SPHN|nr:transporter [Sphingomonas morindae]USI75036.1 transporter [Sphingomonas morindae]